jgi:hypothetical protein
MNILVQRGRIDVELPDPACPPTFKTPLALKSLDTKETRVLICRSDCAKEYAEGEIIRVVDSCDE